MRKATFSFAVIRAMPRPAGYFEELTAIALSVDSDSMTFDEDDPRMIAMRQKHAERDKAIAAHNARQTAPEARPEPELPEPSLLREAANFSAAMARWAKAGFPVASEHDAVQRQTICSVCEHFDKDARAGLGKCRHPSCGCAVGIKTWLSTEKCPINKWSAIPPKPLDFQTKEATLSQVSAAPHGGKEQT